MACLWKRFETRHAFSKEALGICEMMAMRSSEGRACNVAVAGDGGFSCGPGSKRRRGIEP